MFLNAFVQYNGETDSWLSNTRFNLILSGAVIRTELHHLV